MKYTQQTMEEQAALEAAAAMCAAARTAPKAKGVDLLHTMVLTGEDKDALARSLEALGQEQKLDFYLRDAQNLRQAQAVVLIGTQEGQRGLGKSCGYCHFAGCDGCAQAGGLCAFDPMDLGIALGSAAAIAADRRVDTRIMYSVGKAALALDLMGPQVKMIVAIPVAVQGKSPFFDRKKKT